MKKIDSVKLAATLRTGSAITIGILTILGMLYTNSFEALIAVLFIGTILIIIADSFFSR